MIDVQFLRELPPRTVNSNYTVCNVFLRLCIIARAAFYRVIL